MELRYPLILIIIIIIITINYLLSKKKKQEYTNGSKIANTQYLKNNNYYKKKIKEYNILKKTTIVLFIIALLSSSILIARLKKYTIINDNQYNRDIFLCMDVSASVDELNLELIDNLKDTIKRLHKERFGISIFNTSSIVLVPLTDDYDYVINILDEIKKSIQTNNQTYTTNSNENYLYIRNYIISGTLEGNELRGSSLIGDGLASCSYNFSNNNRTKIIILSTDNNLEGTPLLTLDEAAIINKNKGIKVFGIGTKTIKENNKISFKNAVEKTKGKYYEHSTTTTKAITNDIEKTSKSLLKNQAIKKEIDIPQIPFIILLLSITGIIFISKKVTKWKYFQLYLFG